MVLVSTILWKLKTQCNMIKNLCDFNKNTEVDLWQDNLHSALRFLTVKKCKRLCFQPSAKAKYEEAY